MIKQVPQRLLFLLFLLLVPLLLTACKKQDSPPMSYQIENYTIPSLHQVLGTDVGVLDSFEIPEADEESEEKDGAEESKGTLGSNPSPESGAATVPQQVFYYSELPHGGLDVQTYAEGLMDTPDLDLNPVNAAARSVPLPDFTEEEGFVLLSMSDLNTERMLRVLLSWAGSSCIVRVSIMDAPRPSQGDAVDIPTSAESGSPTSSASGSLTAKETVTYFQSLSPAVLGLEGDSMDAYNIYYLDGKVLVNDSPCSRVRIYAESPPEGSNAYVGTFLVAGNRAHLYRLDLLTEEVVELNPSAPGN